MQHTITNEDLAIGDRVRVRLNTGNTITGTITEVSSDIKNGRPGIDIEDCSDDLTHWCYTSQVLEIITSAPRVVAADGS